MMILYGSVTAWIRHFLACIGCATNCTLSDMDALPCQSQTCNFPPSFLALKSSGCLGCCTKPTPIIAVDEPSKRLKVQGRMVKKPSISEDFWSTSTCEIDNSAVQSQRSISSISTSNRTLGPCSGTGSTSSHTEFTNHGLLLWNQTRFQWVGSRSDENRSHQIREPRLSWNATYESLLGTSRRFTRPVPLSEMIEFLVDIWEQEGMYD